MMRTKKLHKRNTIIVHKERVVRNVLGAVAISLSILFIGTSGYNAYATDATLTISLSSSNVTANVAPFADATGTFVQSSPITVNVSTDNATGYTLGIKANDNTYPERLINSTDSSYLSSINSATSFASFRATDLSSITTSGGNQGVWGYLPSKLNSVANTDFLPSPGTAGNTIDETSGANSTTNTYTIAIGAKVSPLATLGAYTNSFMVTVVANPIPYTISYSENTVSGMPDNVISGSSEGTTVTISSTTPTRYGYQFLGWCDQATTNTNGTDTCASGHQHQPGGTVTLDATANANNIKLYAMWGPATYMQDLTTTNIASSLPNVGDTMTATDRRDGKGYTIGKLADNKYWMLENLNLDLVAVSLNDLKGTSTKPNTNASDATLGYLKNGGGSGQYTGTAVAYVGSSNTYNTPLIAVSGTCSDAYCVNDPESGKWTSSSVTEATINGVTSIAQGKIGVYYNYCAASAGSYCYASGTSSGSNATEDICPAGWRLPTGGDSGEFYNLYATGYSSNVTNFQTAFRTPLSGYLYSGTASDQGNDGCFWSSTYRSGINMYNLYFDSSSVYPSGRYYARYFSYSVRCLLAS